MDEDSRLDELLHAAGDDWRQANQRTAPSIDRMKLRGARTGPEIRDFARSALAAVLVITLGAVVVGVWAIKPSDPAVSVASPSVSPTVTAGESTPPLTPAPSSAAPSPAPATLDPNTRANEVLSDWADFIQTQPDDTIFVMYELTAQDHGWSGNGGENAKSALYAGMLEANVDIPTAVPGPSEIIWPDGSTTLAGLMPATVALDALRAEGKNSPCFECTPVHVVGVRLTTHAFNTSRGVTELPSWEFALKEGDVHVYRVAAAHALALQRETRSELDGASADGPQLTVWYLGGACDHPERLVARVVESDLAVVAYISVLPEFASTPPESRGPCITVGIIRSLTVELDAPLGSRTVLDMNGIPVRRDPSWLTP